jgi:hypothetical protein
VEHGDFCNADEAGTELPDNAAARDYALRVIRELKGGGGYDDPRLRMIITDPNGRTVLVLPFAESSPHH